MRVEQMKRSNRQRETTLSKRIPILKRLVDDGLFSDRKTAFSWLLSGEVTVNGSIARPGDCVSPLDILDVPGLAATYASRGGLKLEGALSYFGLSPDGQVCIDAGASTGGFTDCLLRHGAAKVYAVDVGFGQLTGKLRQNPRVVNLEKTNLSDASLLELSPVPSLGTCDLSYLSLRKAVPYLLPILHGHGDLICLVKPLFETEDAEARRTGILNEDSYSPMLHGLIEDLNALQGVRVLDVTHSPVVGNRRTLEFFLHLRAGIQANVSDLRASVQRSVDSALQLLFTPSRTGHGTKTDGRPGVQDVSKG